MLQTLARIASQLESDGHTVLADEVDEIITAIAAKSSFPHYGPGDLWAEERDDASTLLEHHEPEADEEEEMRASSLRETDEMGAGVGYSQSDTYSDVLAEHAAAFARYIKTHPLVQEAVESLESGSIGDLGQLEAKLVDELDAVFDELSAAGKRKVKRDAGFASDAKQLVRRVLLALVN